MGLADTLSGAYLPIEAADQPDEFEIHVLDSGRLSETMLHKLTEETKSDLELQQLQKVVIIEWLATDQRGDTSGDKTLVELPR